ncbi:MAG: glycosyltransferase [Muribaculaceae bacterium]|nr:glycosyltransferase [Muribaculaceae bacterium]
MYIDINLPLPVVLLLSASFLLALYIIVISLAPARRVLRQRRLSDAQDNTEASPEELPEASVIVCCRDENELLEELLPTLLTQEYAPGYEVIVVNEGENSLLETLVADFQIHYPNLYLAHTPDGARNLSRKKLAITLGIKAARYPVAVITGAQALIHSTRWLASIMAPFADEDIEMSVAPVMPDAESDTDFGRRTRAFDTTVDTVIWLNSALRHRPWRAHSLNMAYRRSLFFRAKGFARSLNKHQGDDDIFVNQVATRRNTAVVLDSDALVYYHAGGGASQFMAERATRIFTGRFTRRSPRRISALNFWLLWLWTGITALAVYLDFNNIATLVVTLLLTLILLGFITATWRSVMISLHSRHLLLTLPWMAFTRPLRMMWYRVRVHFIHSKKYTWE